MPETRHDDLVRPFQIDPFGLRGRLVRLGPALDTIIRRHGYPDAVATLLGEAAALAALLAGALKYDGIFTLQIKGDGPIRLLVTDVTSDGALRGYATFDAEALRQAEASPLRGPVPRLFGAGYLAFTVDQGEHTERYQGIVELTGATLVDCAQHYFRQSEQLGAGLTVAATELPGIGWRAGGIMLQRLPSEGDSEAEEDGWRRALLLLGSASAAELVDPALEADGLLFRLFHEDGVRVYPPHPVAAKCRCSRERVASVLASLPPDDRAAVVVDGAASVTCEFCSTTYVFTAAEIAALDMEARQEP